MYWGKLLNEYIIETTPTFLTEEELETLERYHKLIKKIGNIDIEFTAPFLQKDGYSSRVEKYRRTIEEPRRKVQEIDGIITELEVLKSKLPMGPYEVTIDQSENFENPHK